MLIPKFQHEPILLFHEYLTYLLNLQLLMLLSRFPIHEMFLKNSKPLWKYVFLNDSSIFTKRENKKLYEEYIKYNFVDMLTLSYRNHSIDLLCK